MIVRVLIIFLLGLVGLVGLGMSLCGGFFTLAGLVDLANRSDHSGEFRMSGFLVIAVPSLLAGLVLIVVSVRALGKRDAPNKAPR